MAHFYYRTVALLLVFTALCAPSLEAQDSIFVTVEHALIDTADTFVDVTVIAQGEPEILGLQLSLNWAEDELEFQGVTFGTVLSDFRSTFSLVDPGEFRTISIFDLSSGVTSTNFQSDSLLLTLRFAILPGFSGNTPLFSDLAIDTEFIGDNSNSLPFTVRKGFVSYGEPNMRTSFSPPYPAPSVAQQFCVDLIAEQAYSIAGFELELNWDAMTFPLADLLLGDNPFALTQDEVQFSADRLVLDRAPEGGSDFPAILDNTVVASFCFTTDNPDSTSPLSFGGGRDGNTVYGYSPTGEVITLTNFELEEGSISQPEASGIFGPTVELPTLKIYPNPARDIITLEGLSTGLWELTLWDGPGQQLRQETRRGNTLDLSSLPPGTYTLGVAQGSTRWLNRLVVAPR